jgi:hypothetical protein
MASITNANRSRAADAVVARANSGRLRAYSGTIPADANTALSGQTTIATLTFGATAFPASTSGLATANAITADTSAAASGRPSFARVLESDVTTVVWQMLAAVPWVASTAYSVGDNVVNTGNSNQYRCTTAGTSAASGGPSGTGTGIADNTAVWAYVGAAELVLTPASGSQIVAGGNVSVTSLIYTQSAS